MIILYTILQLILLPFLFIPLTLLSLSIPRYRLRSLRRLGIGLKRENNNRNKTTIWVHALSVGEVTSSLPLLSALRKEIPNLELVFSTTTRSGEGVAAKLLTEKVDRFVPFPFDFLPIVKYFIHAVRPDLFILVETDFWPALLASLKKKNIPTLLVNGRISKKSFQSYQRYSFFFKPLFASFHTLSMQTERDKDNLIKLGIDHKQVRTLGNLKYDTALYSSATRNQPISFSLPEYRHLFIAGSTHAGEEEIIIHSFNKLKQKLPDIYLIIAPRDINRGRDIQGMATAIGLQANCRSQINAGGKDILILDTIGELNKVYSHAHVAFVGGSFVAKGGHNPIEPAIFSVPVLFGPHMEDFSEISEELMEAGGAIKVADSTELTNMLHRLFTDRLLLEQKGEAARNFILSQQGVIKYHIELIKEML